MMWAKIKVADPIFAPVREFLAWRPKAPEGDSALIKAIGLYQNLLAFHAGDSDKSALIDADRARLRFGYNLAVRVQLKGEYQSGMASIECLYAPEFNSHSASAQLTVK